MSGVVHAGSQFRWHEELCRIRVLCLREATTRNGISIDGNVLPQNGGVYCFWWTGDLGRLKHKDCNRSIQLHGPGGRAVVLEFDDEWLGLDTGLPLPLYVGKNAGSIAHRIGQHLRLKSDRITPTFSGNKKQPRPTTSCQARAGVEHLFPKMENTRDLMLDNVGLSWVELPGDENAANRFYLEDLAVGLMRPMLNIDIER